VIVAHFSQPRCFPKINKASHTESALNFKDIDEEQRRGLDTTWFCIELVEHYEKK